MDYQERISPHSLPAIERIWLARDRVEVPRRETIFPDGRFELIFLLGDRPLHDGRPQPRAILAAEPRRVVSIETAGSLDFIGIRLRPGAARAMLGAPPRQLRDRMMDLEDLWGGKARKLWEIAAERGADALLAALRQASAPIAPSRIAVAAAETIRRTHGRVSVSRLASSMGISVRTLSRAFDEEVGISPKTLCRVVRMQRAVSLLREGGEAADVAVRCGFYDQPHLANELRSFAGLSPSRFLEMPDGLAAALASDFSKTAAGAAR